MKGEIYNVEIKPCDRHENIKIQDAYIDLTESDS